MRICRAAGVVGIAIGASVLVGCSVPSSLGYRLNADDTVDFVLCGPNAWDVEVDYLLPGEDPWDEDAPEPEWVAETTMASADLKGEVVRYGEDPRHYSTVSLADPPDDWTWVSLSGETVDRENMVEGQWVWRNTSEYPWVPNHPCDGVDLAELER